MLGPDHQWERSLVRPEFLFVIDTEQYAGNFERELCAWCTGQIGMCEVGSEEAADFKAEHPAEYAEFSRVVEQFSRDEDDHTLRPACLVATPGWLNNGLGYNYRDDPSEYPKALEAYIQSALAYDKPQLAMIEQRLASGDESYGWTKKRCEKEKSRLLEKMDKLNSLTEPLGFPAYLSVGIGFNVRPTQDQNALMKVRAASFAELHKLSITGFRLLIEQRALLEEEC